MRRLRQEYEANVFANEWKFAETLAHEANGAAFLGAMLPPATTRWFAGLD